MYVHIYTYMFHYIYIYVYKRLSCMCPKRRPLEGTTVNSWCPIDVWCLPQSTRASSSVVPCDSASDARCVPRRARIQGVQTFVSLNSRLESNKENDEARCMASSEPPYLSTSTAFSNRVWPWPGLHVHTFPTLEATQGQIISQSPTYVTRFWWHLYVS